LLIALANTKNKAFFWVYCMMIHLYVGKITFGAKSVDLKEIGGRRKEEV
jgi:hypothetical protein